MNSKMTIEELRELFLSTEDAEVTRILAIVISGALVTVVLWLVRRRSLQEEYTPIWMVVAAGIFLVSLSSDILQAITRAIGAWTTSSTVFFLGEFFLMAICLNYAVRLSRASLRLKNIAQEVTLLKAQVEQLEARGEG